MKLYRYRCTKCERTFRHYPQGISHTQQSERIKKLAVVCWALGLSYRGLAMILSAFGVSLSRMSGWRDVQAQARHIRKKNQQKQRKIVGVDGAWLNGKGIMVAVDMGDGQPIAIAQIEEKDQTSMLAWLKKLQKDYQIEVIVTDDLNIYRGLTQTVDLEHQVCQFHVRRWVGRDCWKLQKSVSPDYQWMLPAIQQIIDELPHDGSQQLLKMYKQLPPPRRRAERAAPDHQLRHLLIRLSETWHRYTLFQQNPTIPWTNNLTEQAIGRMKMRARTVRAYKSTSGKLNRLLVSSSQLI